MPRYALYSQIDGKIERVVVALEDDMMLNLGGLSFIEIDIEANDLTHYVLDGALAERPTVTGEVEVLDNTWSLPVPPGTQVQLDGGEWQTVEDGAVEFATAIPGVYVLTLRPPFPYQEQRVTINAY